MTGGSLKAQQLGPKPANDKPLELTRYDKRIPADAWALFTMDFGSFDSEFLTAFLDSGKGIPKSLVNLVANRKLNFLFPHPFTFGLGGSAVQADESMASNPALMDFLRAKPFFGLYLDPKRIPEQAVPVFVDLLKTEIPGVNIDVQTALEIFRGLKKNIPPVLFVMNNNKGSIDFGGTLYDKELSLKLRGKGLPKKLLEAIPHFSMVTIGVSLNLTEGKKEILKRRDKLLGTMNMLQKILQPEDVGVSGKGLAVGFHQILAEDLLSIFGGDFVMAGGVENKPGHAPYRDFVIGATVKDEEKLTKFIDNLKDAELLPFNLPDGGQLQIIRKPGLVFFSTPNLRKPLEKGTVRKPYTGPALELLKENQIGIWISFKEFRKTIARLKGTEMLQVAPRWSGLDHVDFVTYTGKFDRDQLALNFSLSLNDKEHYGFTTLARLARIETLMAEAQFGDADAMYALGSGFFHGRGMEKDVPKGFEWLKNAANANHREAQYVVATAYWTGQGPKKDMVTSYYWMSLAAAQEHLQAARWKPKVAELITLEQRDIVDKAVSEKLKTK